jgi:hypothetical protein
VKPVKGWKKRHRGRKPAVGRVVEPKELTRSDCGYGKKLAAACRKVFSCATVARHKRNNFKKIGTQGNCGPRKEYAAAGIRTTSCAKVARGWEHGLQRQGKDDIAPRTRKGRTEENRRSKGPKCKNCIRNRGLRQHLRRRMRIRNLCGRRPLYLRNEGTTSGIYRRTIVLEIAKQVVGTSNVLRKIRKWILWRSRHPPKWKKRSCTE